MTALRRTWFAVLPLLVLSSGCGSSGGNPTAPGTPTSFTLRQMMTAAVPATVTVPSDIDTTASLLFTLHVYGPLKGAGAAFISGGQLADAGNVWIRESGGAFKLLTKSAGVIGVHSYVVYATLAGASPATINIPFDGTAYHVFQVDGSSAIPAFVDSVQSVDDLDVSAPVPGAMVTRASGLQVNWSDPGGDANVKVAATVIANADTTLKAAAAVVGDPAGTVTIPAIELNRLPAGGARLAVARYRMVYKVAGTHLTGFICETLEVRDLTLN